MYSGGYSGSPLTETDLPLTDEQKVQLELEKRYLDLVKKEITAALGNEEGMNEYGAFYIDKTKFVFDFAKEDARTKQLIENLSKVVPSAIIEVKRIEKTTDEPREIQDRIHERLVKEGYVNFGTSTDVMKMKVVISIGSISESLKNDLVRQYGKDLLVFEEGIEIHPA
jgi:hypothetical protein